MTHASTADSAFSIDPGLIRLSVGIEAVEDLIEDLTQALEKAE
jgi:cystathionine gamma-synthase